MNSRWLKVGLFFSASVLLAAGYAALRAFEDRKFQATLAQAKQEMAEGRFHTAKERLLELRLSRPGDGEVEYHLGACESARGNPGAAIEAWSQVPPSSRFASTAAVQLATAYMKLGRFSRAEEILLEAYRREPGSDSLALLKALGFLFQIEGRTDDLRRSIIESWAWSDSPRALLRQLSRLDTLPPPLGVIEQYLEKIPSDDDRAWLGRANLATRTGHFELASKLVQECLKRRPDDLIAWRARLELARAAGDFAAAWQALEHLPSGSVPEIELARIRAWLARSPGTGSSERDALLALIQQDPGDTAALDRLAALAATAGDNQEMARIRAKRAVVTAARERYRALLGEDAIIGDSGELAQLASILGRRVEARGWEMIRDSTAGRPGPTRPALFQTQSIGVAASQGIPQGRSIAADCGDLRPRSSHPPVAKGAVRSPRFVDLADSAGLRFVHDNGASSLKRLPETMSGGIALLDYDGDGWLDVYAVQGGPLPQAVGASCTDRLFRNRGNGTFEDASESAGVSALAGGYGHGVAVGDYDNDGRPDLFITRLRSYLLLHNRGNGKFEDVTSCSGLAGDRDWPTSAAWADLDGDGDIDLYVCHYLAFDLDHHRPCTSPNSTVTKYCSPRDFESLPDHVFRNDGGRFVDITKNAGFTDPGGRGLGVLAAHLDEDDLIDLYVANDMSANFLFRNLGSSRFHDDALSSGAAANCGGGFQSGMGVAAADADADGRIDLAVTNYYGESTTFFRNLGRGLFCDDTASVALTAPSRCLLGFGIGFLDANNDRWLDLLTVNGHVDDLRPVFPWRMPIQLLLGAPDGQFREPTEDPGEALRRLHLGRALAIGDLDNDGRLDAVALCQNEPLVYLHNETAGAGHWLSLQLEGVRSNRDAVGARLTLTAGNQKRVGQRTGGGSYQSACDSRLHFGLGDAERVDHLEVRWPSGQIESFSSVEADHRYLLREGTGVAKQLRAGEANPAATVK
jgi:enediyne biosynthesis protein E4